MEVAERDDLRAPGFYLRGGFDPSLPFPTKEEAESALRMRKGNRNAVKRLVCPYTGKPLKVVSAIRSGRERWYITGEYFNPYASVQFEDDLLYAASYRGGKAPKYDKPERETVTVSEPLEKVSDPTEGFVGDSDAVDQGLNLVLGDK